MKNYQGNEIPPGEEILCQQCGINWHEKKWKICIECAVKLGFVEVDGEWEICSLSGIEANQGYGDCDIHGHEYHNCYECEFLLKKNAYRLTEKGRAYGLTSCR